MKIVVLDGYTLNPGDLSWDALADLGDLETHEFSRSEDTVPRARDAEIVLTNKTVLSAEVIERLPKLQYIGVLATGYNVVHLQAARDRGVPVTNIPTYGTTSVAQMVFAHILNFTQRVAHHADTVRQGRWSASRDFCYWDHPLIELDGQTMGVVGFGRIGQRTADLARAFGMKLVAHDPVANPADHPDVEFVSVDDLFARSDFISLHCPLTDDTHHLVNAARLEQMKPTAFLVNTSRGPVIDEPALAAALEQGQIAGAGLDVLEVEPPRDGNPLIQVDRCVITPHIAWATRAARSRLLDIAVDNVKSFLDGNPVNVVN